jgi:HEXXH motif-containing protein
MLSQYYRGFSCPHGGLDRSFLELLIVEHTRQTIAVFLCRHGDELRSRGGGLDTSLDSWLRQETSFDIVWDPAFGGARAALLNNADDPCARAAALALRLHECGHSGRWRTEFNSVQHLRFGRSMLPSARRMEVSATPDFVAIATANDVPRETCYRRNPVGWQADGAHTELPAIGSGHGTGWTVFPPQLVASWEFEGIRAGMDDRAPRPLLRGLDAAVGALADSGDYLPWVRTVVRHLVPWFPEPGEIPSGSSSTSCAPGVIGIGNHDHFLGLADTLVHEASHQYYYILSRLGPVDDGSDQELYENPFLKIRRPIDKILLAYHAFANVLLLCRSLRTRGFADNPYVLNREEYLLRGLATLDAALQATVALSPLGRALWEPLREQIHAH